MVVLSFMSVSKMKKFLIHLSIFFAIIILLDRAVGCFLNYCHNYSKGDQTKALYDLCMKDEYDVLIMGSSQAQHHYVADLLADSLHQSVYNAGMDGYGIIMMNGIYQMISERYSPKMIIYNVTPSFDCYRYTGDDNNKRYITPLKPYYSHPKVKSIVDGVSPFESVKMLSWLYRYNTSFLNIIKNHYKAGVEIPNHGYEPLSGVMNYEPSSFYDGGEIDTVKVKYLREFMGCVKERGTELIMVISPRYGATSSDTYSIVKDLCKEYNVTCLDHYTDSLFVENKDFYEDPMHLNHTGATLFTKIIINQLINIK